MGNIEFILTMVRIKQILNLLNISKLPIDYFEASMNFHKRNEICLEAIPPSTRRLNHIYTKYFNHTLKRSN